MPSSRIDTTGISGSGTVSRTAHARSSVTSVVWTAVGIVVMAGLPGGAGVLACEALHFGQHETHVLGMLAVLARRDVFDGLGQTQCRFVQRGAYVVEPCGFDVGRLRANPSRCDDFLHGVRAEKLA